MDATSLVALARENAPEILVFVRDYPTQWSESTYFVVYDDGFALSAMERGPLGRGLLSVKATPENVASENALVRALLASVVTVITGTYFGADADLHTEYIAEIGSSYASGDTRAEAVNALLDALLGEVTT